MWGCCFSSRKPHLHGTPIYYHCPPVLEEHESLTSHDSILTTLFLVDLNLDTSTPDTYQSPPVPIPYNMVLGCPQSTDSESLIETTIESGLINLSACVDLKKSDCRTVTGLFLGSPIKLEVELLKFNEPNVFPMEEEDVCPICLEDYDAENPKIVTKCNHHFHLPCILEWVERSDTCPICDQEMIFEAI